MMPKIGKRHAPSHEDGGNDEVSVAGLSGELADDQPPKDHGSSHESGEADEINATGLVGVGGLFSGVDVYNVVGTTSSPDTSGTAYAVLPEMTQTIAVSIGDLVLISISSNFQSVTDDNAYLTLEIRGDGTRIGSDQNEYTYLMGLNRVFIRSFTRTVKIASANASYVVDVRWKTSNASYPKKAPSTLRTLTITHFKV